MFSDVQDILKIIFWILTSLILMPLDHNFSIFKRVARSQTKRAISNAKHAIGLKLEGRLALG